MDSGVGIAFDVGLIDLVEVLGWTGFLASGFSGEESELQLAVALSFSARLPSVPPGRGIAGEGIEERRGEGEEEPTNPLTDFTHF